MTDHDLHGLTGKEIARKIDNAARRAEKSPAHLSGEIADLLRRSAQNVRSGEPPLTPPDR
jgi:hypothetical protein